MEQRFRGMNAVVTGASSGVGAAIARAFAAEGANVALLARNREGLEAVADAVRGRGGNALVLPLDVADPSAVEAAAARVVEEWGGIDIWVNNAMVSVFAPVVATRADEYRRVTEVNYLGYVHGTLAALRYMRPRDAGVIMQIGSALAYRSIPLQSAYCATKAAIRGFTDSLRSELIRENSGIAITMLHLPAVNTPQFEVVRNRLGRHPQPVPPVYQPEVIGRAAVHAVLHPRRELWIGMSTALAIVGQRVVPGFLDRYLARNAWDSQITDDLPPGHPLHHEQDNVDATVPGVRGVHGPFDDRARDFCMPLWLATHRGVVALLALGAALAVYGTLRGGGGDARRPRARRSLA